MPRPRGSPKFGGRKSGTVNKLTKELRQAAQDHAGDALAALVEVMTKSDNHMARIRAACEVLDRGYGKSTQHITAQVEQTVEVPVTVTVPLDAYERALREALAEYQ